MQIPDTISQAVELGQVNINNLLVLGFLALIVLMIVLIVFMYRIIKTLRPDNQAASAQASQDTIVDLAQTISATTEQSAKMLERLASTQDALVKMQGESQATAAAFTELTRVTVTQQGKFAGVIEELGNKYVEIAHRFAGLETSIQAHNTEEKGHFGDVGTRLDDLDTKMEDNGKTIINILAKLDGLERSLNDLRTDIRKPPTSTPAIEHKLNEMSADLVTIRNLLKKQTDEVPAAKPPEEKKAND